MLFCRGFVVLRRGGCCGNGVPYRLVRATYSMHKHIVHYLSVTGLCKAGLRLESAPRKRHKGGAAAVDVDAGALGRSQTSAPSLRASLACAGNSQALMMQLQALWTVNS